MEKSIVEMEIRKLEALLKVYTRVSEQSDISAHSQEETINNILDKLSELYKLKKKP